ncbi:hypothetical protein SNEBB_005780 [Seison nebaliae]|nr:hypothetical protein SNEBB_005780 [Seison nebaliae]
MTAKLTYWDGRGRAEIIRLALAAADVKWTEDTLLEPEQLDNLRKSEKLMFQQVPLLEIDGLNLVQSDAIVRYICGKYGMLAKTSVEAVQQDMICNGAIDAYGSLLKIGFDPKAYEDALPLLKNRFLPIFEKLLLKNNFDDEKNRFIVGNKMTIADLYVFLVLHVIYDYDKEYYGFNVLKKYYKTLRNDTKLAGYLNSEKAKKANDEKYMDAVEKVLRMKIRA